jgi:hypothetical protein
MRARIHAIVANRHRVNPVQPALAQELYAPLFQCGTHEKGSVKITKK